MCYIYFTLEFEFQTVTVLLPGLGKLFPHKLQTESEPHVRTHRRDKSAANKAITAGNAIIAK